MPVGHLRRVYGRSVMGDVVQNAVNEANRKIVEDNSLKLAFEPQVQFPENKDEVEKAMDAKGDLAFTVALEVLPVFDLVDLQDVSVKKPVAEVSETEVDESLERMAKQNRAFEPKEGEAVDGDRVVVDFVGRIDGDRVRGRQRPGHPRRDRLEHLHPGLRGSAPRRQGRRHEAGEGRRSRRTTWRAHLAGKDAEFDVTVKEVEAPGELMIDDELAKGFGMESLDKLKDAIRGAIQRDFDAQSRRKVKKELLDALDAQVQLRTAAEPGRAGIRGRLGAGRGAT